jgi:hypothetical protein
VRILFAVLSLLLLPAAPASADGWSGTDPARDHVPATGDDFRGRGDIVRVDVEHRARRVLVDTVFRTAPYDELVVRFDTRSARRGPEYGLYKTHLGVSLWRLHRDGSFGERLRCSAMAVRRDGRHVWAASVARRCLGEPGRVRVQVHSSDESGYNASDWAPGRRTLTPWLRAG